MLGQMKQLVTALHELRVQAEETDGKLNEESLSHSRTKKELKMIGDRLNEEMSGHAETRKKLKALEGDYARTMAEHSQVQEQHTTTRAKLAEEANTHQETKLRFGEAERSQANMREALESSKNDISRLRMANERLETEKETLRVIIYDKVMEYVTRERKLLRGQYEALQGEHVQTKASLDALQERYDARDRRYDELHAEHAKLQLDLVRQQDAHASRLAEQTSAAGDLERTMSEMKAATEKLTDSIRRSRLKTIKALEKQFLRTEAALQKQVLDEWFKVVRGTKTGRLLKDKGMARCLRNISGSDEILKATCFSAWSGSKNDSSREADVNELEEYKRLVAEHQKLTAERAAKSRAKAQAMLERQFLEQDGAMRKKVWTCWITLVQEERQMKSTKEKAMKATIRNIAGGAEMLKTMCFQAWSGIRMSGERAMELRQIEEYKKHKAEQEERAAANKQKAQDALRKQFMQQDSVVRRNAFDSWRNLAAVAAARKLQKERNTQRCMRSIMSSAKSVLLEVFTAWEKSYSREQLKAKLDETMQQLKERDEQLNSMKMQLTNSAWVAKEIQSELSKAHTILPKTPRKPRPVSR
eukprot:CAMPEP_0179371370 /NCGR_PEP_ID=MMETSP0797-20121207/85692_1 /TAXON_ID=47934 /ORGANISM="Dinophysis acuminata, Strain DAEP01" /LENGTH=586 /DNA_ID=CAMNT_0021087223 /DNA_START=94 /DNA_END=1851 /DNA_ORIENTATION=-